MTFDANSLTDKQLSEYNRGELTLVDLGALPEGAFALHSAGTDLDSVKEEALRIVKDETILSTERLIHLRSFAQSVETKFTDTELRQQLWTARRVLAGVIEPHKAGSRLLRRKAPFLWQGVVMKEATTLVVSLPKVGKSRLLCQFIGHLHRGESEFLGQQLFGPCPPVLIVGSDQDEGDWAECLHLAGLLPGDQLADCIVALYDKGRPLHLDNAGIETIADTPVIRTCDLGHRALEPLK